MSKVCEDEAREGEIVKCSGGPSEPFIVPSESAEAGGQAKVFCSRLAVDK
jgi:hypothetical protein